MDMLRDIAEARTVTVLRDGKEAEVYMPEISLLDIAKDDPMFVTALVPNVVDSVIPGGGLIRPVYRREIVWSRSMARG